ncbi:MAG: tyrosine-type recombinase/integrase [Alphaproteobacteria bacterium]
MTDTTTIDEASELFLFHCRVGKVLSANTLRAYTLDLADFAAFSGGGMPVVTVDREHLRRYAHHLLVGRGLKETSLKRRMACLKVMFRWLEREETVALSPFHRLDLSIRLPKRLPRALGRDELVRLLEAARVAAPDPEGGSFSALTTRTAVVLMIATGMRVGEAVGLACIDVDLADGVIRVHGKGDRERRVFVAGAEGLLRRYLATRHALAPTITNLLVTREGKPLTAQALRRRLRRLAESAGLPRRVTPHMLRHSAATRLLEAGVDIRIVQKLLGHASISTTQIYTAVSDATLKSAIVGAGVLDRLASERP